MMNELPGLLLALVLGAGLGLFFFGGLWLTLQKLPTTGQPVLLVLGSLVLRMSVAVVGFYLVMDGSWLRLLACVLGFFLMRQLLIRWLRPSPPSSSLVRQQ